MRRLLLTLVVALGSMQAMADRDTMKTVMPDSVNVRASAWTEVKSLGKMAQSAYPINLTVKGNSLCVSSKHSQVLPIYTQGGSLYLAMKLTPGENWLYGLPRGRYRINNRIVNIM